MQNAARGSRDSKQRGPIASHEGIAAIAEYSINMLSGRAPTMWGAAAPPEGARGRGSSTAKRCSRAEHAREQVKQSIPTHTHTLVSISNSLRESSDAVV